MIRRILTGDAQAQRELYDAHVGRIFRLAYRMTGESALAEDLTQDTFIRAFGRLADFRGDGPFGGWLHRIATSVIYSALRKRQRIRQYEVGEVDPAILESATAKAEPDRELRRRLDAAIETLDVNSRMVFVMHDLEGYTHPEIAEAMDTPVGTAKARLSRAREKLRALLTDNGSMNADLETGS